MISYWKDWERIYEDGGLFLMIGWYNHKNKEETGTKELGVHWGEDYPQSRGVLSPCVIPPATRTAILAGLLQQSVLQNKESEIVNLLRAIKFFNE